MSSLDFISLWRAQPFRPFRVNTLNNTVFDVVQAQQVGISPGLRLIVVAVADNRFEVLVPEQIGTCEVITDAMPAIPLAAPTVTMDDPDMKQSPGGIKFLAFTGKDGRGLVQFTVSDRKGNPILSTAGTRWDLHGLETFENGRSLYIHHADDPTLMKRIIVWPPNSATLDSFAEAMPPADLMSQLMEMDADARANPQEPPLHKEYLKSVGTIKAYVPPKNMVNGREEEISDEERFTIETEDREAGPHHWVHAPQLTDTVTGEAMLDLFGTNWDASHTGKAPDIVFELRHYSPGTQFLEFRVNPIAGMAKVNGNDMPLTILGRHLANYVLYENWDSLMATLASTPVIPPEPHAEVVFAGPAGSVIEMWPGAKNWPLPFLSPRIVSAAGKTILDMRGSVWTAMVRLNGPLIWLHLIHKDPDEQTPMPLRIDINPVSHRVTAKSIPGSTVLAELNPAIHKCRTASWMLEELQELFARGADLPLP